MRWPPAVHSAILDDATPAHAPPDPPAAAPADGPDGDRAEPDEGAAAGPHDAPGKPELRPDHRRPELGAVVGTPPNSEEKAAARQRGQEDDWIDVFKKLQDDNYVHHDDMPVALELLGCVRPNQTWVDEVFAQTSKWVNLALDEFILFVQGYAQRQKEAYREEFELCDTDNSGTVDVAEIISLLKKLGVEPMKHVMEELILEVDSDGTGNLDFQEFETLMDLLRSREGFTTKEFQSFRDAHRKFDRDRSGEIDTTELLGIFGWLGFTVDTAWTEQIVKEVDFDGSNTINEREFILCMRKVRERQVAAVKEALTGSDLDGSGTISRSELDVVFQKFNYITDPEVVEEVVREVGVQDQEELNLSDLWRILTVFRAREGISMADAADVTEVFNRYDTKNEGEISILEISKALRWLGVPLPFEVQQNLIAKFDIDGTGKLSLHELLKLVRVRHDKDLQLAQEAFEELAKDDTGVIGVEQAWHALEGLGLGPVVLKGGLAGELHFPLEGVDIACFISTVRRCKRVARRYFRENCGFSFEEVQSLRESFCKYDTDNSGDIGKRELIRLIEARFPVMAYTRERRPQLQQLIREADEDGSGSIDFQDYLRLMSRLRDMQQSDRLVKELQAVQETGFSQQEVGEFRELFLESDADGDGELTLEESMDMMKRICPLGAKSASEFVSIFRSITGRQAGVDGSYDCADFPEFLWLMHKLLHMNFASIKERTNAAKSALQQKKALIK